MERWAPVGRSPEPRWGAIDRFLDYGLTAPFFGFPFQGGRGRESGLVEPAVDLFETDEHMVVKAELPGLDPAGIEVKVTEDSVSFRGETGEEREERGEDFHWRERRRGLVQRIIPLPRRIDPESAMASFHHGVLTIRAVKSGGDRGRKVKVDVQSAETGYGSRPHRPQ